MVNIPYFELQLYLMNLLNKTEPQFSTDELSKIEELYLDPIDLSNKYNKINFELLKSFPNLKKLEICNSNIDDITIDIIAHLPHIEALSFNYCHVSSVKGFYQTHLKALSFNNCTVSDLENIALLKGLNRIKLINMNLPTISYLENLPHLVEVDLSYSNIEDLSTMYHFILIEDLKINGTNIIDLDFVDKYSGLQRISISYNQYEKNKALIDDIVALNIMVYEDDVICYNYLEGEKDE